MHRAGDDVSNHKIEHRVVFRPETLRRPLWATSQQNSITEDTITACMHARSQAALLYRGSLRDPGVGAGPRVTYYLVVVGFLLSYAW